MASSDDLERDLQVLESDLRRLEAEYNMFFAGRLPKPPWETRARVAALVTRIDRGQISNYGDRFRFGTLQSRFATCVELWDRGLKAREEGRPGPFSQPRPAAAKRPDRPEDRILRVATFRDPLREMDKLHELYDALNDARRTVGTEAVPFHKFAELIKGQVAELRKAGSPEVAFRVAIRGGKVNFTARALTSVRESDEG